MGSSAVDFDVGTRERFWKKVSKTGHGGCWVWTAATLYGYGRFGVDGKNKLAHCVAYAMEIGAVPEGKELDHKCRNRACVRPSAKHVRPATRSENRCNSGMRSDNTSGYVGVSFFKPQNKWVASITQPAGPRIFLGYFTTAEAAHRARTKALKLHHGPFAAKL